MQLKQHRLVPQKKLASKKVASDALIRFVEQSEAFQEYLFWKAELEKMYNIKFPSYISNK